MLPSNRMIRRFFTTNTIKFCSSCKYLNNNVCMKFSNNLDLVTGKTINYFAEDARKNNDLCGTYAKYFEQTDYSLVEPKNKFLVFGWYFISGMSLLHMYYYPQMYFWIFGGIFALLFGW